MRGGKWRKIRCHSIAVLLHHPKHGWTLFDAGYAPRILRATRRMPYRLYRLATPLHLRAELAVVSQLAGLGLCSDDIRRIMISHFHADHVAGLRDFPRAEMIARASAYEDVKDLRGVRALRRAFLPHLMPSDFETRATLLPAFNGPSLPGLGPTHDLFGDGSLLLVELPGHAHGQIGMLANTERGKILFAADGCWLTRQIREQRPPHPITYLIADDARAVRGTIDHLHAFAKACPDVTIIPSHCPEAFAREVVPWL
jgi:glyoxylase-like metal-dependent hydrolase (beta-lactamase superfamily II)